MMPKRKPRRAIRDPQLDLNWLPAPDEWDFRRITAEESRLATCWEYARSIPSICNDPYEWAGGFGGGCLSNLGWHIWYGPMPIYGGPGLEFPLPWLTASEEMRAEMAISLAPDAATIVPIHEIKEKMRRRAQWAIGRKSDVEMVVECMLSVLDENGLEGGNKAHNWPVPSIHLIRANFPMAGSNAVVEALELWARREAKKFPKKKLAKAAEPPFDRLKWLAAYRLDLARVEANRSFTDVQATLKEYQRQFPITPSNPTLPIYASPGAWSKAKGEAGKMLKALESDPVEFERKLFHF